MATPALGVPELAAVGDGKSAARGDGAAAAVEALVDGLTVTARWELAPVSRGEDAPRHEDLAADHRLLALEASDGSTVFMRADALAEQLQRARPELIGTDGMIDFAAFREPDHAARGLGDWVWRAVSHIELP